MGWQRACNGLAMSWQWAGNRLATGWHMGAKEACFQHTTRAFNRLEKGGGLCRAPPHLEALAGHALIEGLQARLELAHGVGRRGAIHV